MNVERAENGEVPKLLGQDLYRKALKDDNLGVFGHVVDVMTNDSVPVVERANAFRAVRFGLVGLAIEGWQNTITQPIARGPQPFGSGTIAHEFVPSQFFPRHEHTIEDTRYPGGYAHHVSQTQGEHALNTLYDGLQGSMRAYLRDTDAKVGSMEIPTVLNSLLATVKLGRELDLDKVPDLYSYGQPFITAKVYEGVEDRADVIEVVSTTARNPIRFFRSQVLELMNHYSGLYPSRFRQIPSGDKPHPEYTEEQIADMLLTSSRYVIRSSQRMDGTGRVPDSNSTTGGARVYVKDNEVKWLTKNSKGAPRRIPFGETPPKDSKVAVTARQKCPVGYTPDATIDMPVEKLYDGIFKYLDDAQLLDPIAFSQPKKLATALG